MPIETRYLLGVVAALVLILVGVDDLIRDWLTY